MRSRRLAGNMVDLEGGEERTGVVEKRREEVINLEFRFSPSKFRCFEFTCTICVLYGNNVNYMT